MSCCNSTTGQVLVDPCSKCNEPSAENETLPSALDNFINEFFGTLEKSVVNGAVVWTLPCGLNVGLENNPRQAGEGLACYFLRLFEAGIIGLTGPQGEQGDPGEDGKNGYSVTTQAVAQASAECQNIAVPVVDDESYSQGLYVFIPFSGYFLVQEVQDNILYLSLVQLSTNAAATIPAGTIVVPAGASGAQGAKGEQGTPGVSGPTGDKGDTGATGDDGFSAQAELLTGFSQPSAGAVVGWVTLSRSIYAAAEQYVWIGGIQTGGYYKVLASTGAQIQIENSGDAANAAPGTAIPASIAGSEEWVVVTGPIGVSEIPTEFSWKSPARLVEDSNITLTGSKTIDGVATADGDRVLVTGQSTASQNGLYEVNHSGAWSRSDDADATGELPGGTIVVIQEGDQFENTAWILHTVGVIVGTTAQDWNQYGVGEIGYADGGINAGAVVIAFSGAGSWTIVTGMGQNFAENFTFAANQFTAEQNGRYKVDWSLSFLSGSATADVIHAGVAYNGTILTRGRASRSCSNSSAYGNVAGCTIVDLNVTDTLELQCMNATDTDGITIIHAALSISKIATG
jgi:hypothetical protein